VPLIESLWLEPGKRIFPDVMLKCETTLSVRWDKEGIEFPKLQYDENGKPILEDTDFVKKLLGGINET